MAMTSKPDRPDDIDALLPWAASGRLGAQDRAHVEEALASRPDLRRQMRLIGEEREAVIAFNQALGGPSPAVWERILAALSAEPRTTSLKNRLAHTLGALPLRRLAFAAAALVIVLETAAIVKLRPSAVPSDDFGVSSAPTARANGPSALVAFAPGTKIEEIGALLKASRATIVDGPHSGFSKNPWADPPTDKGGLESELQRLRAKPAVRAALVTT